MSFEECSHIRGNQHAVLKNIKTKREKILFSYILLCIFFPYHGFLLFPVGIPILEYAVDICTMKLKLKIVQEKLRYGFSFDKKLEAKKS